MIKNKPLFCLISILIVVLLSSCKTQFEKVRTNPDANIVLVEANKYYSDKDYYKAITLYELIIPVFKGKEEGEDIFNNYAYSHYYTNQYILAAHYFKQFAKTFINSTKREEADFMSAYSNYKLSPSHKLDQSYSEKSVEEFQQFVNKYPKSERVQECNDLIDEIRGKKEQKAFDQGMLYYNMKQYSSSTRSFENMLKDFPETKKSEEVRYIIAKSTYFLAKNSIYEKKEERYLQAIDMCKLFLKKNETSKYKKEVNSFIENSQNEIKKLNK